MEATVTAGMIQSVTEAIPLLLKLPVQRFWVDYDAEADVLYISFRRPQHATRTQLTDEGVLLRYQGKNLVGLTILDASARLQ